MKLLPLIEQVLAESELARNSDTELNIQILQQLGMGLTPAQIGILWKVNLESIRRCRQKLQEQGKYPGSPEVMRRRRLKSYVVQQNAPSASPKRIEAIIEEGGVW